MSFDLVHNGGDLIHHGNTRIYHGDLKEEYDHQGHIHGFQWLGFLGVSSYLYVHIFWFTLFTKIQGES